MQQIRVFGQSVSGRSFVKMHGLLNHFVIVDARSEPFHPAAADIVRLCDVRAGVGGDQLIVVEPATEAGVRGGASAFMRILNVDAREVEACGNATRCLAWLLLEEQGTDTVTIETLAGLLHCARKGDKRVSCTMGKISGDWRKIPLAEERITDHLELSFGPLSDGVALNIGNPHIVFFVADLDAVDIEEVAPKVQRHPLFPQQVNVGVAQMIAEDHMRLVVYERGVGLTTACGSGACVAAFAARLRGLTDKQTMKVEMPAGTVVIDIRDDCSAVMTGPVEYCFAGILK